MSSIQTKIVRHAKKQENKTHNEEKKIQLKPNKTGNSLAVQWLELQALTAEGLGSIPGWGTKIPQAMWHSQRTKNKNKQTKKPTKTKKRVTI